MSNEILLKNISSINIQLKKKKFHKFQIKQANKQTKTKQKQKKKSQQQNQKGNVYLDM